MEEWMKYESMKYTLPHIENYNDKTEQQCKYNRII